MAHQTWSQLSSRLHGALQNAVEIAFRLGRSDAEWAAPRFGRFDPTAIKHEVADPHQLDRTHPVFYSVQETFEGWTQALMELGPRQAYVRIGSRTARIKTLQVDTSGVSLAELQRVTNRYAELLLKPREPGRWLGNPQPNQRATTQRVVRIGETRLPRR